MTHLEAYALLALVATGLYELAAYEPARLPVAARAIAAQAVAAASLLPAFLSADDGREIARSAGGALSDLRGALDFILECRLTVPEAVSPLLTAVGSVATAARLARGAAA